MTYLSGKFRFSVITLLLVCAGCSVPQKQFYQDMFYEEDKIYENKPLRFIMKFEGNWVVFTDPNEMDPGSKALAKTFAKSGVELLFVGATVEGMHGTRGIAVNFNEPANDYAARIRALNKNDIQNDQGLTEIIVGRNSMVKWVYEKGDFRFVEFFFTIDSYDIRIAFWCKADMFGKFLSVFENIISTVQVTGY